MTPSEKREEQLKELERTVNWLQDYVTWLSQKELNNG